MTFIKRLLLFSVLLLDSSLVLAFENHRAEFSISVNGIQNDYSVFSVFSLPGEVITIQSTTPITAKGLKNVAIDTYRLIAPDTYGLHDVGIATSQQQSGIKLQIFVMHDLSDVDAKGFLKHYKIGFYPEKKFRDLDSYTPPSGALETTHALLDQNISPHFKLGQFVCKQPTTGETGFLTLNPRLIIKLEKILALVNEAGIAADSFVIMSGYRTPHYNHSIGNGKFSRHQWGDAADIFIDVAPKDGVMDDLNRDGKVDEGDATWLYDLIDRHKDTVLADYKGGLGKYKANSVRGPFVHIDTRGYEARWGF